MDKLDVTHSGTAGFQALLAGILRGEGNVKANLDNSAMPWAAVPSLVAGTNGVIHFKVGLSDYTVPCMIIKVHFQSAVEGKVEYDFDVALNVLAGSGAASISRPAS